jgi:hypothetical protein
MNCPILNKSILILMNELKDYSLQPICQNLSDQLDGGIQKRDGPIITYYNRVINFWNQSDIGSIKTL